MRTYVIALAAVATLCAAEVASASFPAALGELLVSDRASNRVLAFDSSNGAFRRVVVDQDVENLFSPAGLAIGFGGDLFVTSQGTGKVLRYDAVTGAPKGNTPGSPVFLDLGLAAGPTGVLYDSLNDRLFVSLLGQADSNTVKIYNGVGSEIGSIAAGPLGGRSGMVLDADGNLIVNSFNEDGFAPGESGAVLKFAGPDFSTMTTLIEGDGDFQTQPIIAGMNGLALDDGGNLYAASLFGQQVVKLTTGGMITGVLGSQAPPTAYPSGVAVQGESLLVSTLGNNNPADPIYGEFQFPGSIQKFSLAGEFEGVLISGAQLPGGEFQPTAMLLVPNPVVPGDFNSDGNVDGADFVIWQTNFPNNSGEATLDKGDANGDGNVDGADFVIWQTNFPFNLNGGGVTPVPEPAAWLLFSLGVGALAARRAWFWRQRSL